MGRVRSLNTKPEMLVRRLLHKHGFRFRLHRKDLPGQPDIYLPKHRLAVFVHGCFWHGHEGCKRSKLPSTNSAFWENKIAGNRRRDAQIIQTLHEADVLTVVLWECELKDSEHILHTVRVAIGMERQGDG